MKKKRTIRKLVFIAILTAIIVVLQLLGNLFTFANGMALALVPVAVGAILYGPGVGALLGFIMALIILTQPANYMFATSLVEGEETLSVVKVIILILIKTTLAGFVSGLLFKLFYFIICRTEKLTNRNILLIIGVAISSIILPVINTGSCALMLLLFFNFMDVIRTMVVSFFALNFVIEMIIAFVTVPGIVAIINIATRRHEMGYSYDLRIFFEGGDTNGSLN